MFSKLIITLLLALTLISTVDARLFPLFRRNRRSSSNVRGGGNDSPAEGVDHPRGGSAMAHNGGKNNKCEEEDGECEPPRHHGGGPGGPRGPPRHHGNATQVENDCPIVVDDPVCLYDKKSNETGVWVCREEFDPEVRNVTGSFSYCSSPDYRHDTDTCGCCGGECPIPCTCACDLDGEVDAGVLVLMSDKFGNDEEEEVEEVCMDPEMANHKVSMGPRYSCAVC